MGKRKTKAMKIKNEAQNTSHLGNSRTNESIPGLINTLRTAFRAEDFDRVEDILQGKEDELKQEIKKKTEEIAQFEKEGDFHSVPKNKYQTEIKTVNERAEYYEKLLRNVKNGEVEDYTATIAELTKKNTELETAQNLAEEELELWTSRYEERVSRLEEDIKMLNKSLTLDCSGSMEVNQGNGGDDNRENSNGRSVHGCLNV